MNITCFIKAVLFHHIGISWVIATKEKINFSFYEQYGNWCTVGIWFYDTVCNNLHGPLFE